MSTVIERRAFIGIYGIEVFFLASRIRHEHGIVERHVRHRHLLYTFLLVFHEAVIFAARDFPTANGKIVREFHGHRRAFAQLGKFVVRPQRGRRPSRMNTDHSLQGIGLTLDKAVFLIGAVAIGGRIGTASP